MLSQVLAGALLLTVFRVNDNHSVRLLAGAPGQEQPAATALPDLPSRFDQWIREPRRWQELERHGSGLAHPEVPGFHAHTFAISGVSGGSVGASLYAPALDPGGDNRSIVARIDQAFDHDHLSPVLAAMLFGDRTQRFYPLPVPAWDRALGLELSFEDSGVTRLPGASRPWRRSLSPIPSTPARSTGPAMPASLPCWCSTPPRWTAADGARQRRRQDIRYSTAAQCSSASIDSWMVGTTTIPAP